MTEEFQRSNPLARGDKNIKPMDVFAEHTEIRKQVHGEIKKLYKIVLFHDYIIIDKFLGCLSPLKQLHDPGRLPVYATRPVSTVPDKRSCVWVLVSCLIQAYWEYESDSLIPDRFAVDKYLNQLKKINEHYSDMKVVGAENKGWWLEL